MAEPKLDVRRTLIAVVAITILMRFYYAWIMRDGPAWQVWFAVNPGVAMLFMVPVAAIAAWLVGGVVGRNLGHRLIVPSSIAGGAAATAMVNGVVGASVGALVGVWMISSNVRIVTKLFVRFQSRLAIVLGIGALAGWFANEVAAGDGLTRSAPSLAILAVGIVASLAVAVWLGRNDESHSHDGGNVDDDEVNLPRTKIQRYLLSAIGIGFALVFAWLGLRGGVESHRYWQIYCLCGDAVGSVSLYQDVQPNLRLLLGQDKLVAPLGFTFHFESDDNELQRLRFFREIESLEIYGGKQTAAGFARLGSLPALRYVWLQDVDLDDDGLAALLPLAAPNVAAFINTQLTYRSIPLMKKWPLQTLRLDGFQSTKNNTCGEFAACRTIEWLQLDHVSLTDADLSRLATLPALRHISMVGNDVQGKGLMALGQGRWLRSIDLSDNPLDDQYLRGLLPLKLKWLDMNDVSLTPGGWFAISQMKLLDHLSVQRGSVDARHLQAIIPKFVELREVELDASSMVDHAFRLPVKSVKLHVADQTLEAADISRLAALATSAERDRSTDVQIMLTNCVITPSAVAEFCQQPARLFGIVDCKYDERFDLVLRARQHVH